MTDNHHNSDIPSFSGNSMPLNISLFDDDDDIVEVTRRVAFEPIESFGSSTSRTMFHEGNPTSPLQFMNRIQEAKPALIPPFNSTSASWILSEAPEVPAFGHPLEPTSVFVPNTTASTIAKRVSSILHQQQNIQVEYEENEASCLTLDNIEFSVFLYQGKNQYQHGIIVEVQRFSGNSFSFYDVVKEILEGVQDEANLHFKDETDTTHSLDDIESTDENIALDTAMKMLLHSNPHVQFLGLQILCVMTNPEKTGRNISNAASLSLVNSKQELLSKIFDMVIDSKDKSVLMQATRLLSNVASFTNLPILGNMKRALISLIGSDEPQLAFMASKILGSSQLDSTMAEALHNANKLGKKMNHSALCSLSSNLLQKCW